MSWWNIARFVFVLAALVFTANAQVRVGLSARWAEPPLAAEASEFVASQGKSLFWDFVSAIGVLPGPPAADFARVWEGAKSVLSPHDLPLLNLSLALRVESPRLEMYYQLGMQTWHSLRVDNSTGPCGGLPWVLVGDNIICSPAELRGMVSEAQEGSQARIFEFDHVFPGIPSSPVVAVLFGEIGTPMFHQWHQELSTHASLGTLKYAFRHFPLRLQEGGRSCVPRSLPMAGYGVELALRDTEYKLWMERNNTGNAKVKQDAERPLTKGELANVGRQAAQYILDAEEPLVRFADITQNLPSRIQQVLAQSVSEELDRELNMAQSSRLIAPDQRILLLNGRRLDDGDAPDVFAVLGKVQEELLTIHALNALHLDYSTVHDLLVHSGRDASDELRFDLRSDHIVWLNDVESDRRFSGWPRTLKSLLRPVFPGQLAPVRRNIYSVVMVVEPLSVGFSDFISAAEQYIHGGSPVRWGVLFHTGVGQMNRTAGERGLDDVDLFGVSAAHGLDASLAHEGDEVQWRREVALKAARVFLTLVSRRGMGAAAAFAKELYRLKEVESEVEALQKMESLFSSQTGWLGGLPSFTEVSTSTAHDSTIVGMDTVLRVSNLQAASPCFLVNGGLIKGDNALERIPQKVFSEFRHIQKLVYENSLKDTTADVYADIVQRDSIKRYNALVLPDFLFDPSVHQGRLRYVSLVGDLPDVHFIARSDAADGDTHQMSLLVAVDLSCPHDAQLVGEALRSLSMSVQGAPRLAILHNIEEKQMSDPVLRLIGAWNSVAQMSDEKLPNRLRILVEIAAAVVSSGGVSVEERAVEVEEVVRRSGVKLEQFAEDDARRHLSASFGFCQRVLRLEAGQRAIIANGRVVVLEPDQSLAAMDMAMLAELEERQIGRTVASIIEHAGFEGVSPDDITIDFLGDVQMRVASVIAPQARYGSRQYINPSLSDAVPHTWIHVGGTGGLRIQGIVNPLSRTAQQFLPLVMLLHETLGASIDICLNPSQAKVTPEQAGEKGELPLKSFYRPVLGSSPSFNEEGCPSTVFHAVFDDLPLGRTLTLNVHTPEAWLVEGVQGMADLDNIRLGESSDQEFDFRFELVSLVATGQCFDDWWNPPRGLQLELGTRDMENAPKQDTLVMSNLGYFQLKAAPGVWYLRIAPGRASDVFRMKPSVVDAHAAGSTDEMLVLIDSFGGGPPMQLRVEKRPGMEAVSLLEEPPEDRNGEGMPPPPAPSEEPESGWGTRVDHKDEERRREETINIFTLVSGHLYERLVKIMMVSVLEHTQTPVKFWFLRQYLSPQFKDLLPCMANHYGFTYEYVAYKWPSWLHKQTEKMRTIWAMKVLFLDVLFPLNVSRVIIVDADQVVRTDMAELMNFDLHGAPLAYTPFCSDKKEMDGFRFWKSGFWEQHLRGKPYHISALYLVDLQRFRQIAAGDIFRMTYDQLSKDPNSLSNLDQDLPNYLQHRVPIFSLPQEWLWCESWCSVDSLPTAKTIDLCNNPKTKRNKIEVAHEMIEEYPRLENEVRALDAPGGPCVA